MRELTYKDVMAKAADIAENLSEERSERAEYCTTQDEMTSHEKAAHNADKMAGVMREMARSYIVIFYGEDREPNIWTAQGDNARQAVLRAWHLQSCEDGEESYSISEAFKRLHGVYPGFAGPRVPRKELAA